MIKINLLPHREAKRKELKSQFYSLMMFAGLIGAAVLIMVGLVFSSQLSAQSERNSFIKKENDELDLRIKFSFFSELVFE